MILVEECPNQVTTQLQRKVESEGSIWGTRYQDDKFVHRNKNKALETRAWIDWESVSSTSWKMNGSSSPRNDRIEKGTSSLFKPLFFLVGGFNPFEKY